MKGRSILATALLVLFIGIIGVTVWGIRYTNSPDFCDSCHIIKPYVESWNKSFMGGGKLSEGRRVTCVDCHFAPGVIGYMRGKVYSLMKLTEYGTHKYDTPPPSVDLLTNTSCLQCHGSDRRPDFQDGHNVVDASDPTYPQIAVQEQYKPETAIMFPHDFHVNKVQLKCADCHSAVVHGTDLIKDKPQADNTPEFCASCHSGDIAPILFGDIKASGREHPGVPKIDTAVWRNNHWRVASGSGEIDGVKYEKMERDTCLACHKEPSEAKNCKSCHFHSEPSFAATTETQRASGAPLVMFGLVIGIFLVTLVPYPRVKKLLFEGWTAVIVAAIVVASDMYAFVKVIEAVLDTSTGGREIGPSTLWVAYLMASASLLIFLFHQGVLKPRRRRLSGDE